MEILFTGKGFEVTDAFKQYAERKLKKYERQVRKLMSIHVVQSLERNWHNVDIHITADGTFFRGVGKSDDMYTSVDLAVEKIETQIQHRKGKIIDRAHGRTPEAARAAGAGAEAEAETEEGEPEATTADETEAAPRPVRMKRPQLTPMSVEEAIDEMELLEHQFLVFANGDTGRLNVVYRRDQGDYGLIDPDY